MPRPRKPKAEIELLPSYRGGDGKGGWDRVGQGGFTRGHEMTSSCQKPSTSAIFAADADGHHFSLQPSFVQHRAFPESRVDPAEILCGS